MLQEFFSTRDSKPLSFVKSIENHDGLQILRLKGNIDTSTIPEIGKKMWGNRKKLGLFNKNIIMDFKDVKNIDTTTVAVLIRALAEIKHKNSTLVIINVTNKLKTMFEVMKVEKLFSLYDSEKEALNSLKNKG